MTSAEDALATPPSGPPPVRPPAGVPPSAGPSPDIVRFLLAVPLTELSPTTWTLVRLLLRAGAQGIACHVVLRPTTSAADPTDGDPTSAEESRVARQIRARLVDELGSGASAVTVRILHGDPGERICEYADYVRCKLIVLGPRGKSRFGRWVQGSVSRFVTANSRRSIVLIGD